MIGVHMIHAQLMPRLRMYGNDLSLSCTESEFICSELGLKMICDDETG